MKSGIYHIICKSTGKRYVGRTVNFTKRFGQHKSALRNNKHGNEHLQNAWNKYGEENFVFLIYKFVDKQDLVLEEQKQLDDYQFVECFNKTFSADNSYLTAETRKKISLRNNGREISVEQREKISKKLKGRKLPEETKLKMRIAQQNRLPPSDETRRKLSEAAKRQQRKPTTDETKQKLREAAKKQWERLRTETP
jgi:group I intron endonuclease